MSGAASGATRARTMATVVLLALLAWLSWRTHRVAWERTLVPLGLDVVVTGKELRHEKHPGRDDVHVLRLEGGRELRVDARVHEAIEAGDRIEKLPGETTLRFGEATLAIEPTRDARGALPAMLCLVLPAALLAAWTRLRGRRS